MYLSGGTLWVMVAPYAGAWIETAPPFVFLVNLMSPLMQGRGLKLFQYLLMIRTGMSPLMQGRGLKLLPMESMTSVVLSPLMQGRGLKRGKGY